MRQDLLERLRTITDEERRILADGSRGVEKDLYMSGPEYYAEADRDRRAAGGWKAAESGECADSAQFTVDSRRMLEKGRLIDIRTHTRFVTFPEHRHNYIEIMYMCSGQTVHLINRSAKVTLQTGDLLFLGQNSCHEIQAAGIDDIGINFMILPEFFDEIIDMAGKESVLSSFLVDALRKSGGAGFLHYRVADILPVQNLVENLVWSLLNAQPHCGHINQLTMGLLFAQLVRVTERIEESGGESDQMFMMQVLRYIEENYRDASLSELALQQNVTISCLSRKIRRASGSTFKELLQKKRLRQAEHLLLHTRLPVTDIIYRVGYDNTSYFHRIFLREYRVSPWRFRREHGEG